MRALLLVSLVVAAALGTTLESAEACCQVPTSGSSSVSVYTDESLPRNPVVYLFESDFSDAPDLTAQDGTGADLPVSIERVFEGKLFVASAFRVSIATGDASHISITQRGKTTRHDIDSYWKPPMRWATLAYAGGEHSNPAWPLHVTAEGQALLIEIAESPRAIEQGRGWSMVSPLPRSWSKRPTAPIVLALRQLRGRLFPLAATFAMRRPRNIDDLLFVRRELLLGAQYCGGSVMPERFLDNSYVRVTPLFADGSRGHASAILPLELELFSDPELPDSMPGPLPAASSSRVDHFPCDWLLYLLAYGAGLILGTMLLVARHMRRRAILMPRA